MSPVHVIVGTDPRAEAMWADAFNGAVDLYRFDRNVDAFERLTAAQAPIDLVVLTPAQDGPFNLTPDQFVARVLEGPLASMPLLANLHVIVVGQLARQHPRAVAVRTLDAAVWLVKFGELEEAPRPVMATSAAPVAPRVAPSVGGGSGPISDSVISRIWAAADDAAAAEAQSSAQLRVSQPPRVVGGGPAAPARLFASEVARIPAAPAAGALVLDGRAPVTGGGPAHALANVLEAELGDVAHVPVAAPVTGALQAARPYELPNGGQYRGPQMRGNQIPRASSHEAPTMRTAPVPPAIGAQVQAVVYPGARGAVADPVLTWSSCSTASVPMAAPLNVAHVAVPVPSPAPQRAAQPAQIAPPMQPPAHAYGAVPVPAPVAQPAMQAAPATHVQADPFVRRVAGDAGVSFG